MGLIKPYQAKKFRGDGSTSHLITATYGKTLKFVCSVKDDVKTCALILKNKNGKIVFEADFKEQDMLELAKSINLAAVLFKEEE